MKAFTDLLGNLNGGVAFLLAALVVVAVFGVSLTVMLTKGRRLPLGRLTALAAVAAGLGCYFMTLCTKDAPYAAGSAVIVIAGGCLLGLIGTTITTFAHLPAPDEDAVERPRRKPAAEAEPTAPEAAAPTSESEEVLPLEALMYENATLSPVPDVVLPLAAAPEMGYDEVLAKAEAAAFSGIALSEAKALVTQISKLKLLPENALDARRRALAAAQEKIVSAVIKEQ